MKKLYLSILFLALAAYAVQAQTMNIHNKDGSVIKVAVSDIDHIDYSTSGKSSGSSSSGSTSSSSGTKSTAVSSKPSSQQAVAADPGNAIGYRGRNGQIFSFQVTGKSSGRIWGGDDLVYTDDSPLGVAAVHAGILRAGQTGVVTIKILPGRNSYPSITRNGIATIQYGKYEGSYQFITD